MKTIVSKESDLIESGYKIRIELIKFEDYPTIYRGQVVKMVTIKGHVDDPEVSKKTLGELLG